MTRDIVGNVPDDSLLRATSLNSIVPVFGDPVLDVLLLADLVWRRFRHRLSDRGVWWEPDSRRLVGGVAPRRALRKQVQTIAV